MAFNQKIRRDQLFLARLWWKRATDRPMKETEVELLMISLTYVLSDYRLQLFRDLVNRQLEHRYAYGVTRRTRANACNKTRRAPGSVNAKKT